MWWECVFKHKHLLVILYTSQFDCMFFLLLTRSLMCITIINRVLFLYEMDSFTSPPTLPDVGLEGFASRTQIKWHVLSLQEKVQFNLVPLQKNLINKKVDFNQFTAVDPSLPLDGSGIDVNWTIEQGKGEGNPQDHIANGVQGRCYLQMAAVHCRRRGEPCADHNS